MNKILGLLSAGFLTLTLFLGFSLTVPSVSMAADGDSAAAASEDGAKKTVKKTVKKKKKTAQTKEAEEDADGEKTASGTKKVPKKVKKPETASSGTASSETDAEDTGKTKSVKTAKGGKKVKSADDADAEDTETADASTKTETPEDAEKEDAEQTEKTEKVSEKADGDPETGSVEKADASTLTEEGSEAGEIRKITINGIEYAFCWCPAGSFEMGAPEEELGYSEIEKQHTVKLSKGFWMLQTEVTQEMYESLTGSNPSYFSAKGFGKEKGKVAGREETAKFPVDRVSYRDALAFCEKISEICSVKFTLPTEAQWEYACRAGTKGAFYTEKAPSVQQANYKTGANMPESTEEVGTHGQNPWKLQDMMGNVSEWCRDYFDPDYYAASPASDPTGPSEAENSERVLRGGSFANMAYYLRSAARNQLIEGAKGNRFDGFRFITVPGGEAASETDADEEENADDAEDADADEEENADDAEDADADEEENADDAEDADADEEE